MDNETKELLMDMYMSGKIKKIFRDKIIIKLREVLKKEDYISMFLKGKNLISVRDHDGFEGFYTQEIIPEELMNDREFALFLTSDNFEENSFFFEEFLDDEEIFYNMYMTECNSEMLKLSKLKDNKEFILKLLNSEKLHSLILKKIEKDCIKDEEIIKKIKELKIKFNIN